jgi:hypothetical protein
MGFPAAADRPRRTRGRSLPAAYPAAAMFPTQRIVFVHGWSVRHTDTYGGLPRRLAAEARREGVRLDPHHVFLGRYISFHDEVTVRDVAAAFDAALRRQGLVGGESGERFVAVTHSTGGPVVREWLELWRRRAEPGAVCPCSHLVMLAPANFGSALAALGRSRVGRIQAWIDGGVEPGQGVLDWLELGSPASLALNRAWIEGRTVPPTAGGCLPFVLTGQTIDRKFYDNLNSYTGELGSDGVVRVAAANLNASYVQLEQRADPGAAHEPLEWVGRCDAPRTAFRLLPGVAHSGRRLGILRSVGEAADRASPTLDAVLACLRVADDQQYAALCDQFERANRETEAQERVERARVALLEREYLHTPRSMAIFRVQDQEGAPVNDFDLLFLAPNRRGAFDANALPRGFLVDRQRNAHHPGTLTFFFDQEAMSAVERLALRVVPRPAQGFAHYREARFERRSEELAGVLAPHRTTLVDLRLRRVVRGNTFVLDPGFDTRNFTRERPGDEL